jgi:hypothetical protein
LTPNLKQAKTFLPDFFEADYMIRKIQILCLFLFLFQPSSAETKSPVRNVTSDSISLSGPWNFKLDPENVGVKQKWFQVPLHGSITLPGSTAENGYGDDITLDTKWTGDPPANSFRTADRYEKYRQPDNIKVPFWLQPKKHYVGKAWYQKKVSPPPTWKDKKITLFLERCHWQTQIWIDDNFIGTQNSLSTPHIYDLTGCLPPGDHIITICVDNTVNIDIGQWGHAVADHTQTNWNGVIGSVKLTAQDKVYIADVQIYPDISDKSTAVSIQICNQTRHPVTGKVKVFAESFNTAQLHRVNPLTVDFSAEAPVHCVQFKYPLGRQAQLWSQFSPALYKLTASLSADSDDGDSYKHVYSINFGMREFSHDGRRFTVNGRKTFLRGTLECCIFPLTGYPAMDTAAWERIYKTAKAHGLNHMRFHSWCPPDAAFIAADKLGIMLHVELPLWSGQIGNDSTLEPYLTAEMDRILNAYGNHPSFCMFVNGNELGGDWDILDRLVKRGKVSDPRHLYSASTARKHLDSDQFYVTHATSAGRVRGLGGPTTDWDFADSIKPLKVPVVSHEIGQWCAYPNFDEMKKYTGVLQPKNFEIFRESLQENHMLDQAEDFLNASGKFQTMLYKEEIETALRTPGFAGFQLLDLHDFPGQGTALVGILDAFWDSKGYTTPQQYRRFCNQTVLLARMKKRTYTNNETFNADIQIAHFGQAPLENAFINWQISDQSRKIINSGKLGPCDIALGNEKIISSVSVPLKDLKKPQMLNLALAIEGTSFANDYCFWVYPADVDITVPDKLVLVDSLDESFFNALQNESKVILIPKDSKIFSNTSPMSFNSIFWNGYMFDWEKNHTLGILCDPKHPALKNFPTQSHANWQWYHLMQNAVALNLKDFPPTYRPIVQVIDDWNTNRRQALLLECSFDGAKLLICSINLLDLKEKYPAARQMLKSIIEYVHSEKFNPQTSVDLNALSTILNIPENLKRTSS